VSKSQKQKRPFSSSKMCVRLFLKYGQGNGIDGGGGGFPKISSLFIHENLSTKKKENTDLIYVRNLGRPKRLRAVSGILLHTPQTPQESISNHSEDYCYLVET
jgi:hypothetical protein